MMLYDRSGLLRALADISWNAGTGYSRDEIERGFLRAELEMMMMMVMCARARVCVCARTHTNIYIYIYMW